MFISLFFYKDDGKDKLLETLTKKHELNIQIIFKNLIYEIRKNY